MRVPNSVISSNVTFGLGRLTTAMDRANLTIASQRQILTMADDPSALLQVMNLRSDMSYVDQLNRNIEMGRTWLTASESALTNVEDLITEVKLLTVQMGSDNVGADERQAAAEAVQGFLETAVTLGNSTVGDRYIFAGSQNDSPAFTLAGTAVTYEGDSNPFAVRISRESSVTVGGDGGAIFGDLFTTLADLKTALENNDGAAIRDQITNLDSAYDRIDGNISRIGGRGVRLDARTSILADVQLADTERLSSLEDVDYAEAAIELAAVETAYQAALSAASKVLNVSLVNYL
ncbi:flagellar hook-associated protein 3 FlgL [Desulfatibacillum alkenivorans DSM 16219]|jgi:flagellar hook-associated protein 3 FlgL|uniref:Flagellar hook-associated protein 3 FlgL n=1 Tax=Desulfatibacillum alkenivorans DSM 16219 TaxID=1121393 RepID=A0A1M6HLG8_9BACT|nr:flagellar hook-associated protein FlgL [Desulfatibacillum alkenivorans]SHJ22997.1 flagellar hook-associated protein 3 FlgL [Desulfatibacillum alkenivorans DSM 16219]